jgi:hypothetical protein
MSNSTDWAVVIATFLGGGIVGGIIAEAYHELKAFLQRRQERSAAALLVRDELRANIVQLEIALQAQEDPVGLRSETYDDLQMILARRLPAQVRDAVRQAYVHARVPRSLQFRQTDPMGTVIRPGPIATEALEKARRAHSLLAPHIPRGASDV